MYQRLLFSGVILLMTILACRFSSTTDEQTVPTSLPPTEKPGNDHTYETDTYRFEIPKGWQTFEEVWGRPVQHDNNYYGMALQEEISLQYPSGQGKGAAFFSVASSPLAGGADLKSRFDVAYENPVPEIREVSWQLFKLKKLAGYEITYQRPWGEPWWKFRDIWLEHNSTIYVLSWHAYPGSFDKYQEAFDQILNSFQFKD